MGEKKNNSNIKFVIALLFAVVIILIIIAISILIYSLNYYNMKLTTIISIGIILAIFGALLYIPRSIAEKKDELVNQIFVVDIFSKYNNDEHIRITEQNILFKYKITIKYYHIFPRIFSYISLIGKTWETPVFDIIGQTQLSKEDLNNIIEKLNELNNSDGDIIINFYGNRKNVNKNEINKILEKYLISI